MTIRVYDVDRKTGNVVRERGRLTAGFGGERAAPLLTSAYPPCRCPRCRMKPDRQ
ncbi:hypothetical protein [Streptomyces laurentii]